MAYLLIYFTNLVIDKGDKPLTIKGAKSVLPPRFTNKLMEVTQGHNMVDPNPSSSIALPFR